MQNAQKNEISKLLNIFNRIPKFEFWKINKNLKILKRLATNIFKATILHTRLWISENKIEYRRVNTITNALFLSNLIVLNKKKKKCIVEKKRTK